MKWSPTCVKSYIYRILIQCPATDNETKYLKYLRITLLLVVLIIIMSKIKLQHFDKFLFFIFVYFWNKIDSIITPGAFISELV